MIDNDETRALLRKLLAGSSFAFPAGATDADTVANLPARARRALIRDLLDASSFNSFNEATTGALHGSTLHPGYDDGTPDRAP